MDAGARPVTIPVEGFRASLVPRSPGVYRFLDQEGRVLYVGKAKDLRARVSSYFKGSSLPAKTRVMISKAKAIKLVLTGSEKEALILEAELIGRLKPRYNVMLRDDKAYPFLRLDPGARWPRLQMVRTRRQDGALYFGPYTSARSLRQTMRLLSLAFKLRSCSDSVMKNRARPCLLHQIKRCSAPCTGEIDHQAYRRSVEAAILFLQGKSLGLLEALRRQMEQAAEALEFERAAELRDRIRAIEQTLEAQTVVGPQGLTLDALALRRAEDNRAMVSVLAVRQGRVANHELYALEPGIAQEPEEILSLFLRRHYSMSQVPPLVLCDPLPHDHDLLEEILTDRRRALSDQGRGRVRIVAPHRGLKKRLIEKAIANAEQGLAILQDQNARWQSVEAGLQRLLGDDRPIHSAEALDISTFGGEASVGSLVRFEEGRPVKSGYRIYKIKTVDGVDDYAMLEEVLTRRFEAARQRRLPLPDLLLIDGGLGQLSVARKVASSYVNSLGEGGLPRLMAIAKPRNGGHDRIFTAGSRESKELPPHDPVLLFLQAMRDEAHRFGITASRKAVSRSRLESRLTSIPGVGPARARALLKRFGSVAALSRSSVEELASVKGISRRLARTIKDHLSGRSHRG